jgi:hypothetical protein
MTNEQAISIMTIQRPRTGTKEKLEAYEMAIKALEQTRWIPVSERLPEDKQQILISISWDNDIHEVRQGDRDYIDYWRHFNHITSIAWMPLPNSYRGGESDAK